MPRPSNIAHRGYTRNYPENTLQAFEAARHIGADGIELDVHLSRDHQPVVIHDASLSRITHRQDTRKVWEVNEAELWQFGIPTLRQVLTWAKSREELYIELKHDPQSTGDLPMACVQLLQDLAIEGKNLFIISFHEPFLRQIQLTCPRFRRGLTLPADEKASTEAYFERAHSLGVSQLTFHISLLKPERVRYLKGRGIRVGVWGITRSLSQIKSAIEMGVDCLITDIPDQVKEFLAEGG